MTSTVAARSDRWTWTVPATCCAGVMLVLAAAGVGDLRAAIVVLGCVASITLFSALLVLAPGRAADVLAVCAIAAVTVPIDKYLLFEQHVGGWPGIRVALADLPLLALVPVYVIGRATRRLRVKLPRYVIGLYLLWMIWATVAALGAARPRLAGFEVASMAHALVVAALVSAFASRRLLSVVLGVLAAQVVVHTGFAAAQVVTGRNVGASWFQGASVVQEALEGGAVRIRPSGLFDHPIVYADMLLLIVPILLAAAVMHRSMAVRAGLLAAAGLGLTGLALTLSRGAWIGTAVALTFLLAWMVRVRVITRHVLNRLLLVVGLAAIVLGAAFGPRAYERFTRSNEGNLRVRFELNWIAWNMIAAHPVAGIGPSHFIDEMARFDPTNVKKYFPATVHNLYLLEASETGIPGLLLCLSVFGAVIVTGARLPTGMDPLARLVAMAIVSGLIGFLFTQLADFSHRIEPLRSLIWTEVGLLFALRGAAASNAGEVA